MAIFSDLIENIMEVFMDDFSVYSKDLNQCLENLDNVLKRCQETHLVLNREKCHFMVREGIVLGHRVSERGIEVDRCDIPTQGLIGLIGYLYQQAATSFPEADLQRTPRLSVLSPEQFGDG